MFRRADLNQAPDISHLSKDLIQRLQDKLHKAPLGAAGWGLFCEFSSKEGGKKKLWVTHQGKAVSLTPRVNFLSSESEQDQEEGMCM